MQEEALYGIQGVFPYLPARIVSLLQTLSPERLAQLTELRLRAGQPILLVTAQERVFLTESGRETTLHRSGLFTVTGAEIEEIVAKACGYSVHSHQQDFTNGYLSLPGGHRIGLCGTAVSAGGTLNGIRAVTSLNVRIAKTIPHAADAVMKVCFQNGLQNILLVGPPGSGKTTVLRALAQQLSEGRSHKLYTCAVIDERMEIFPSNRFGVSPCFADILSGYKKSDGIAIAVRVLSPDIIFCDEIGSKEDVRAITDGMRCGVHFAVTAHAESIAQLQCRTDLKPLFLPGVIDAVILLGTNENLGKIQCVYRVGESNAESVGHIAPRSFLPSDRAFTVCTSA
ncbi:MAG: ATPase, T2SS/T4P/T4SS family [Candidatus Fimenecus sp.]